jgi:hypothetical protein
MNVLIYDIETLKEYFLVVVLVPQEPYRVFKVNQEENSLGAFVKFTEQYKDYYWVGYNNLRFDSQVVEWVLRNNEYWHELSNLEITAKIHQKAADVMQIMMCFLNSGSMT